MPQKAGLVWPGHAAAGSVVVYRSPAGAAYFWIACVRVDEHKAADAGVRNHGAAVKQRDSEFPGAGEEPQDVPFQAVVGAA